MPKVAINTKTGPANIHYTISTPTCSSAEKIDPNLPTIIFVHPVYIAQLIFQMQFSNSQLRRFNLIGLDSRGHGETSGPVSINWRRADAADDIAAFMDALQLPACHFFGLSMGACISLQVAISHPGKALSVFLVSPLPLKEPEDVREGRQEIYDCWVQGFRDPSHIDESALLDAFYGALQLGFNGQESAVIRAMNAATIPRAMVNFAPDKFEEFHTTSVKFFADRKPHTPSTLKKITCPIKLVSCGGDIAYPLHFAQELLKLLLDAGVNAQLVQVEEAPHFGIVTHPEEINEHYHEFIMNLTTFTIPPAPDSVVSPFEAILADAGWVPGAEDSNNDSGLDSGSDEEEIRYIFAPRSVQVV